MPKRKVTKAEVELCFDRCIIDSEDDFFPDPFRYKDLRCLKPLIVNHIHNRLNTALSGQTIQYTVHRHYLWDVPKDKYVIRQACTLHPFDAIGFHFVLNRLLPVIEPKLSEARYSYRVTNPKSKRLFGYNPTEHWIRFKDDIRKCFSENPDYEYLVTTDIAGFFENIPYVSFKKQLREMCGESSYQPIDLLNTMLRQCSPPPSYAGIPQNCDPFSYLCTAFLDFLDKELTRRSLTHFRYVDDIKVACKTMVDAKRAVVHIIHVLRNEHLNLSTAKTDIIPVDSPKLSAIVKDFPSLLHDIDNAVQKKQKRTINQLYPELVRYTRHQLKCRRRQDQFDERLFRACVGRIVKVNRFINIEQLDLEPIGRACLRLLESMPSRSQTLLRFLVLHRNRKYVQDGLHALLQDPVYPWQEMLIWYLLIQCDRIKNPDILPLAQQRARDTSWHEAARNYIYIFLGKHGDYQDRRYLAGLFQNTDSFRAQRSILIAIQEYVDRNIIYNPVTSANTDLILVALIRYIKQLPTAEYVDVDKNIASDIALS